MEKVKVDMTAKPDKWTDVTLNDGTQVKVRDYLPYAEREDAAAEYAARITIVADEENGIVYNSYREEIELEYVIVKYYTNIDVSGATAEEVYDYSNRSGLYERIDEIAGEDTIKTSDIGYRMSIAAGDVVRERGSLAYLVKNRLGYLIDPDKTAEMFARAEGLNEKMIDILGAAKERDAMKAAQKPNVIPGGLSLAKK